MAYYYYYSLVTCMHMPSQYLQALTLTHTCYKPGPCPHPNTCYSLPLYPGSGTASPTTLDLQHVECKLILAGV